MYILKSSNEHSDGLTLIHTRHTYISCEISLLYNISVELAFSTQVEYQYFKENEFDKHGILEG